MNLNAGLQACQIESCFKLMGVLLNIGVML